MNTQRKIFVILGMVALFAAWLESTGRQVDAAAFDTSAIITVTTTNDELNNDGDCSLREAIQAANQNAVVDNCVAGVGDDEISLPAGTYTLMLSGDNEDNNAGGDLDIQSNLTINGAGAISTTIDGGALDRVLDTLPTQVHVVVNDVTITNGLAESGGGILNNGTLTLTNSIVSDNKVDYWGGGIFNLGTMIITDSAIRNNRAVHFNGEGGGIANDGSLIITNSTIDGNRALRYSGGFANRSGTATLIAVTISNNRAAEQGGGLINFGGTELTLINSALKDNSAAFGGAISTFGPLTLTNSTISGNQAAYGGGIYLQLNTVRLNHSTVSANRATGAGGILSGFQATVILANSIVANQSQGEDCLKPDGVIISAGYNLDSDNSCNLTGTGDIPGSNAQLGPLQDNGGATWTHALLPGSAAIDHGDCLDGTLTTDQRGVGRPQGSQCDIGSYETTGAAIALNLTPNIQTIASGDPATFTVTITNAGSITLTNVTTVDKLTPACERDLGNLAPLSATVYHCERPAVKTPFSNVTKVTASTVLGDRVHAEGAGIVKLVGWSDEFLPVVINTTQTLNQR